MELPVLKKMVEEFQCPGCVVGGNTECGSFVAEFENEVLGRSSGRCQNHVVGTRAFPGGKIFLGLPVGFNKMRDNKVLLRLSDQRKPSDWDRFNVPVWAMEKEVDGIGPVLFVRTFMPRIAGSYVDVCQGLSFADLQAAHPGVKNVAEFVEEID